MPGYGGSEVDSAGPPALPAAQGLSRWSQTAPTVALSSWGELPKRPEVEVAERLRSESGNSHGTTSAMFYESQAVPELAHIQGEGTRTPTSPWNGGQRR